MMRICADLLLVVAAALCPWWFVLPIAAVLFFAFENYVEFLLVALSLGPSYGAPLRRFLDFQFALSLGGAILFSRLCS